MSELDAFDRSMASLHDAMLDHTRFGTINLDQRGQFVAIRDLARDLSCPLIWTVCVHSPIYED